MSREHPAIVAEPRWTAGYLRELGYDAGDDEANLARTVDRLRALIGSEPVTMHDCYRTVPRAELDLLAQVIEQWMAQRPWLERDPASGRPRT